MEIKVLMARFIVHNCRLLPHLNVSEKQEQKVAGMLEDIMKKMRSASNISQRGARTRNLCSSTARLPRCQVAPVSMPSAEPFSRGIGNRTTT